MEIVNLLTTLCSFSLYLTFVAEDWKIDNVIPIFKKSSEEDPGNYKSVSINLWVHSNEPSYASVFG